MAKHPALKIGDPVPAPDGTWFHKGMKVRVVRGKKVPLGLVGTITITFPNNMFGTHQVGFEDTGRLNHAGIDRWHTYVKNLEVVK